MVCMWGLVTVLVFCTFTVCNKRNGKQKELKMLPVVTSTKIKLVHNAKMKNIKIVIFSF